MNENEQDRVSEQGAAREEAGHAAQERPSEPEGLEARVRELEALVQAKESEARDYLEGWRRARADHDNFRRRSALELERLRGNVTDEVILSFLPVLDDLERVAAHARAAAGDGAPQGATGAEAEALEVVAEGLEMVVRRFLGVLEKLGVRPMLALLQPFDPTKHEACECVPSDLEENTVVEEVQKGYESERRVIRPALVKVAKGPGQGTAVGQCEARQETEPGVPAAGAGTEAEASS